MATVNLLSCLALAEYTMATVNLFGVGRKRGKFAKCAVGKEFNFPFRGSRSILLCFQDASHKKHHSFGKVNSLIVKRKLFRRFSGAHFQSGKKTKK